MPVLAYTCKSTWTRNMSNPSKIYEKSLYFALHTLCLLHLDLVVNTNNTKEKLPANPQQIDSDSDIEITKVIPGTTDGVTTSVKQEKQTDECSNNVSNVQNNYHSENYTLNEEITNEHEHSNSDNESDNSENIISIDIMLQPQGRCYSYSY